ncbi:ABC transporter permease [Bacilli bacterium]|nr:peptide ABC transporter permease [Bacilli bacterium VT-13-104]PZD83689.1 ABC transporter permease [Bacilli bacterium]PZD84829.1 ABC transporter permease [Bacilli bacterium]PZD87166.1 ABC transporter permease [Bacilli bacterium]RCO05430.1 ABC transporter permease [Bacilli bacterium]
MIKIAVSVLFLLAIIISGMSITDERLLIHMEGKNEAPSWNHVFGTDWLGRDMLARTLKGLTLSIGVGIVAALTSSILALFFSLLASWNRMWDRFVTWLIDLFLSVPHIVVLILISFAAGGEFYGVVIGLALTHWPSITRILRAEILQIKTAEYVNISMKLGKSKLWIARNHLFPHVFPQLFVGFLLIFPHAILHEAAITFLGFGLSPEQPAIGIILSESMRYLSVGMWWLAFFPGLALLVMVSLFDMLGKNVKRFIDPFDGMKS